ncbi:MAG TPA: amidohydrolase family protein [Roseomonas sp.]|jgi:predicted TIM-barrel fold metal-dependent hydrolase
MTRQLPSGACDCHFHVFDERFPFVSNAVFQPPPASLDDYLALAAALGLERAVVVHPSPYGTDNRCSLEVVGRLGPQGRAVAVVDDTVTEAELRRLHGLGVRGIRFNLVQAGATTIEMLEPLARRVADLGWHVQLHMLGAKIAEHAALLASLAAPIVFDHGGRIPLPEGRDHAGWRALRGLVDAGRTWVKLSAPYQDSKLGAPGYDDMLALGRDLVTAAPQRMLWGSDWPHVTEAAKPEARPLLDYLYNCVDSDADLALILRDNPAEVYGFG